MPYAAASGQDLLKQPQQAAHAGCSARTRVSTPRSLSDGPAASNSEGLSALLAAFSTNASAEGEVAGAKQGDSEQQLQQLERLALALQAGGPDSAQSSVEQGVAAIALQLMAAKRELCEHVHSAMNLETQVMGGVGGGSHLPELPSMERLHLQHPADVPPAVGLPLSRVTVAPAAAEGCDSEFNTCAKPCALSFTMDRRQQLWLPLLVLSLLCMPSRRSCWLLLLKFTEQQHAAGKRSSKM